MRRRRGSGATAMLCCGPSRVFFWLFGVRVGNLLLTRHPRYFVSVQLVFDFCKIQLPRHSSCFEELSDLRPHRLSIFMRMFRSVRHRQHGGVGSTARDTEPRARVPPPPCAAARTRRSPHRTPRLHVNEATIAPRGRREGLPRRGGCSKPRAPAGHTATRAPRPRHGEPTRSNRATRTARWRSWRRSNSRWTLN